MTSRENELRVVNEFLTATERLTDLLWCQYGDDLLQLVDEDDDSRSEAEKEIEIPL